MECRRALEAILFVAQEPVPVGELAEVLELPVETVESELKALTSHLEARGSGLLVRRVGAGWRLYTHPDAASHLERFATTPSAARLSQPALETLAVVAYRQPIARAQVNQIRGVDSQSALATLERRGLIREVERGAGPGNPVFYGTSALFLEKLGLRSLEELPPLADHVPPAESVEELEVSLALEEPFPHGRFQDPGLRDPE
ncbi:MAG: SMC-Scp complex subunit ScpB [Actinomycetota bacterium]|nr:SMC-Scp complex subunit ScpB [Actinomycetota bacterium]